MSDERGWSMWSTEAFRSRRPILCTSEFWALVPRGDPRLTAGEAVVWLDPKPEDEPFKDALRDVPFFSTETDAALVVVARLREVGYGVDLCARAGGWDAQALSETGGLVGHSGTLAEAVCALALSLRRECRLWPPAL